jgi:hypothetical protein
MVRIGKITTIFLLVIAVALSIVFLIKVATAEPVDTYHSSWQRVKDSASEDGANFAATLNLSSNEGDFDDMPSEAFHIIARGAPGQEYSLGGAWQFAFYGTDAANETFSFTLVGYARANGMAQIICEGDGVLGTQDVQTEPNGDAITNGFWADTINLDETTKWPSVAVYNASGDNEMAILSVDLAGLEYVVFITYDVAGSSEASTLGVYGRRY